MDKWKKLKTGSLIVLALVAVALLTMVISQHRDILRAISMGLRVAIAVSMMIGRCHFGNWADSVEKPKKWEGDHKWIQATLKIAFDGLMIALITATILSPAINLVGYGMGGLLCRLLVGRPDPLYYHNAAASWAPAFWIWALLLGAWHCAFRASQEKETYDKIRWDRHATKFVAGLMVVFVGVLVSFISATWTYRVEGSVEVCELVEKQIAVGESIRFTAVPRDRAYLEAAEKPLGALNKVDINLMVREQNEAELEGTTQPSEILAGYTIEVLLKGTKKTQKGAPDIEIPAVEQYSQLRQELQELSRMQELALNERPTAYGWFDDITGKPIPYRYYWTTEGAVRVVTAVPQKATSSGRLLRDFSLQSEEEQNKVMNARYGL